MDMRIISTGGLVIPDQPHSYEAGDVRSAVEAIEHGLGDRVAFTRYLGWGIVEELECAKAVHGMKALKGRKKWKPS